MNIFDDVVLNNQLDPFTKELLYIRFGELRVLAAFNKDNIRKEQTAFREFYESKVGESSEEDKERFLDFYDEYDYHTNILIPRLQWKSLFMTIYSVFEYEFDRICEEIKSLLNVPLAVSDMSGKGAMRAKTYLSKVAGIEAPFIGNDWTDVTRLNRLRNLYTHNDGVLDISSDPKQKDLYNGLRTKNGIHFEPLNGESTSMQVWVEYEFIDFAINSYVSILIRICDEKIHPEWINPRTR